MPEPVILKSTEFLDQRGKLEKLLWNDCEWKSLMNPITEVFMTKSVKGSIRGLHFQLPPHAVGAQGGGGVILNCWRAGSPLARNFWSQAQRCNLTLIEAPPPLCPHGGSLSG
jgi:dTDP-4-dehydrorhamnose 3,5-epimerase-like enzyme